MSRARAGFENPEGRRRLSLPYSKTTSTLTTRELEANTTLAPLGRGVLRLGYHLLSFPLANGDYVPPASVMIVSLALSSPALLGNHPIARLTQPRRCQDGRYCSRRAVMTENELER
ncbi:hypothetical protein CGCVW01_v003708 [Colletotrichum viniferum]|nr:hypothetical protein CGCVW01_v003708 [Colletotrichum viniferum]